MKIKSYAPADLIFTTGEKGFLKNAIRWMTTLPSEDRTIAIHVAGATQNHINLNVTEALFKVTTTKIDRWIEEHDNFEIWRHTDLSHSQRILISKHVDIYKESFYGFWKLFLHGFDCILSKTFDRDLFVARRLMFTHTYPICNWIWAYSYFKALKYTFDDREPKYTTPDCMHDHVVRTDHWKVLTKVSNGVYYSKKQLEECYGRVY
jgi:hypothetical protein